MSRGGARLIGGALILDAVLQTAFLVAFFRSEGEAFSSGPLQGPYLVLACAHLALCLYVLVVVAGDRRLASGQRAGWIVGVLFLGPFVAAPYWYRHQMPHAA